MSEDSSADFVDAMNEAGSELPGWVDRYEHMGPLEQQAAAKMRMGYALSILMTQLRRTDAEMRHVTGNKSLKEFETDLMRIMTLVRSLVLGYQAVLILEAAADPTGISAGKAAFAFGILTMVGVTSVGTMAELS